VVQGGGLHHEHVTDRVLDDLPRHRTQRLTLLGAEPAVADDDQAGRAVAGHPEQRVGRLGRHHHLFDVADPIRRDLRHRLVHRGPGGSRAVEQRAAVDALLAFGFLTGVVGRDHHHLGLGGGRDIVRPGHRVHRGRRPVGSAR